MPRRMPRRENPLRVPSYRNFQIYHELAYERRTQVAIAAEGKLSQCRVSQICRKVEAWVNALLPSRFFRDESGKRFHLAIANERIRLHDSYDPLLGQFLSDDGLPRYLRRYVTVVNGQPLNTIEISEKPDFRLFSQALNVQARLAELEAIANRGPFADLPGEYQQSIVHRYSDGPTNPASSPNANSTNPAANANVGATKPYSNPTENQGRGVLSAGESLGLGGFGEPCGQTT